MSMAGLARQNDRLFTFEMAYAGTRSKALEMQSKADEARREPNTSSMTPAELNAALHAHDAGVLNADREAREASEKHAAKCREFRAWCSLMHDVEIPRILADPPPEFSDVERAGWLELQSKVAKHLAELPTG